MRKISINERKKTNDISDIEYAWPSKEKAVFVRNLNLDTKDINEKRIPSSRQINPLDPEYSFIIKKENKVNLIG